MIKTLNVVVKRQTWVNWQQRWKQTRFRVCFHLWCQLTSTIWVQSVPALIIFGKIHFLSIFDFGEAKTTLTEWKEKYLKIRNFHVEKVWTPCCWGVFFSAEINATIKVVTINFFPINQPTNWEIVLFPCHTKFHELSELLGNHDQLALEMTC